MNILWVSYVIYIKFKARYKVSTLKPHIIYTRASRTQNDTGIVSWCGVQWDRFQYRKEKKLDVHILIIKDTLKPAFAYWHMKNNKS